MKVCVVTVTYGNRFKYLKQVIEASLNEGVCKVIVVDNASEEESRNQLKQLEKKLKDKLKVIYLSENTGSAGGYKRGLQEAHKDPDCEFIWLLDDDNVPEKGALKELEKAWACLSRFYNKNKIALYSWRKNQETLEFLKFRSVNWKPNINGVSFLDIQNILYKIFPLLKKKIDYKKYYKHIYIEECGYYTLPLCAYGGLFFHKSLLDLVGYPDEKYYLYLDDSDFTFRINLNNGKIFFIPKAKIIDLEKSWTEEQGKFFVSTLDSKFANRVYYTIRNRIIFSKKYFVDKNLVFILNVIIFVSFYIFLGLLKFKFSRIYLLLKATFDGLKYKKS